MRKAAKFLTADTNSLTYEPLAKLNKTVTQAEAEGQKPLKNLL
jgi:hypothetical protein